ncbi:MAG: hypothetical protein ACJ77A_06920 [Actinomycetota bacterium]
MLARIALWPAGLLLAASAIGMWIVLPSSSALASGTCTQPDITPPSVSPGGRPVVLTGPKEEVVIDLGHDNSVADVDIPVTVTAGVLPAGDLQFLAGPFRQGKAKIDQSAVAVRVNRRLKDGVELNLCIDPAAAGGIAPGTYTGSIQIRDPRLEGQDIPVKATRQLGSIDLLGWVGVPLTAVMGVLGIWLTERRSASKPSFGKGTKGPFLTWFKVNGLIGLALGGAAAFVLWGKAHGNASFGAGTAVIVLLGGMIVAAYTGSGLSSAAAGARDGTESHPPPAAAPARRPRRRARAQKPTADHPVGQNAEGGRP